MKHRMTQVVYNQEVMPGVHLLRLTVPEIALSAHPGQFLHLRCTDGWDPLLRRPLSLHRVRHPGSSSPNDGLRPGQLEILFARVGRGTERLARLAPGDMVDVLGPLGKGFSFHPTTRHALIVAGGMGIAPLLALVEGALGDGIAVTLLAGSRTASLVLPPERVPLEAEYVVTTDDGTYGRRGVVTDLLPEYLSWADQVFACGPEMMLRALADATRSSHLSVQASLEQRMGCGVGACLGCVIRTQRGPKRVCRDGPVFELREVEWP